jgi:hypothetical protein
VKRRRPRPTIAAKTARQKRRPATRAKAAQTARPAAAARSSGARTEYRIYPSIGIARVGDSRDGFFIGPEAPGVVPAGPFRGSDNGIKPQGARFRVFQVDIDANQNETVRREVTGAPDVQIEWTVQLANRKAAAREIFGTGSGTLTRNASAKFRNAGFDRNKLVIAATAAVKNAAGAAATRMTGSIAFAKGRNVRRVDDIELATLRTDDAGRLIVVGGPGTAGSPENTKLERFADNDGWYDSVSDGPVSATLRIGKTAHPVIPAWVVITVPRYAPGVYGIVTWFDQALNMARTSEDGTFDPPRTTSFLQDIYPILKRTDALAAVHFTAHGRGVSAFTSPQRLEKFLHDPTARKNLLDRITRPNDAAANVQKVPETNMPMLNSGANPDPNGPKWVYLSLTPYQLAHLQHWAIGDFANDWRGSEPMPTAFANIPVARQPHALNEAALEACVGGPFLPGIEGTYDIARISTYHPERYLRQEFRIDPRLPAGSLTEKMALPWQADFADCDRFWWPSQRPVLVTTKSGEQEEWTRGINDPKPNTHHRNMVSFWSRLAFIVRDEATGKFSERDRLVINGAG